MFLRLEVQGEDEAEYFLARDEVGGDDSVGPSVLVGYDEIPKEILTFYSHI